MSRDATMGNSGDHLFGTFTTTMARSSDLEAHKWITIPENIGTGNWYFGYKIDPIAGETSTQNNQVRLTQKVNIPY